MDRELGQLSGTALGYGLDDWGFKFWQRLGIFLFTNMSRLALCPPSLLSNGYQRFFT
jgi:hypothetical protein